PRRRARCSIWGNRRSLDSAPPRRYDVGSSRAVRTERSPSPPLGGSRRSRLHHLAPPATLGGIHQGSPVVVRGAQESWGLVGGASTSSVKMLKRERGAESGQAVAAGIALRRAGTG